MFPKLMLIVSILILIKSLAFSQEPNDLELKKIEFKARSGESISAEVGRFTVPENRKTDSEKRIALAFVRFKSTNPNPGSPIVYLAGGPGGSGSGTAEGSRFPLFMAMREIADVIAFDQRGTGKSDRLPRNPEGWSYPLDKPGTREAMLNTVRESAKRAAQYWKEQGVDLSAYNTAESADDLEALRKVLGAKKISLWSISYGTHLAFAAINRHPNSIDRVILAGTEGPDQTVKPPSQQQALLEEIDALVKADPEAKVAFPDFLGMVKTMMERLDKEPAMIEVAHPQTGETVKLAIGKFDLQRYTAALLRGPSNFKSLPAAYKKMLKGDFSEMTTFAARLKTGNFGAMSAAMDAASGLSDARRQRIEKERKECLLGDAINFPYYAVQEGLGVPDLGDDFRKNPQTDIPALFISGTLDGRTPVENATIVRKGFRNSSHLIIKGAGHSDPLFLSSPRIAEVMLAFMHGKSVTDETITLEPINFIERKIITLDKTKLDSYAGKYRISPELLVTVERQDDHLHVDIQTFGVFQFYAISETTFFIQGSDVELKFLPNDAGEYSEIKITNHGTEYRGSKVE